MSPLKGDVAPVALLIHDKGKQGSDFEAPIKELEGKSLAEKLNADGFALLIPDEPRKGGADWTLETAVPLVERAAGGTVAGIVGRADPFEAVAAVLRDPGFDEVIVSTLPRRVSEWLRRDLPSRIEKLGVPVTTVSQSEAREHVTAPPGVRF